MPYDHALLEDFGVLVRPELLAQLDVSVGDALTIGSQRFTIRGVIEAEPGRRLGAFSIGPRVFVDLADLEKTGPDRLRQPRRDAAAAQGAGCARSTS